MFQELCLLPSSGACLSLWYSSHCFYFKISDNHIKIGTLFTLTDSQVTEEYCSYKSTYVTVILSYLVIQGVIWHVYSEFVGR